MRVSIIVPAATKHEGKFCSARALEELTADGTTVSVAIRQALVDSVRLRRREKLREEAHSLLDDADDLAESRAVLSEMDALRAW